MEIIKPYRFVSKKDIEKAAENLLHQVQSKRHRRLKNYDVAETIADFLDLSIVWMSLEPDQQGEIAAIILPTQQKIIINENIRQMENLKSSVRSLEGFKNSTLAHEIGHWILHINHQAVTQYIDRRNNLSESDFQPFLCRSEITSDELEWQAQYFSSCLLMPVSKLVDGIRGRDLTRWAHLYALADDLGVTISNLKNRLIQLNWITLAKGTKQIYLGRNFPKKE